MASTADNTSIQRSELSTLRDRLPLVGLTGGIGSGKTTVSDLLKKLGAGIVDTDLIAHQITTANGQAIPAILARFGADFIDASGALDRAKMRSMVFTDPQARKTLEEITHPLIRQETIRLANMLAKNGAPYLVFVVPLLIESGSWLGLIDYLIVVDCPEESQIKRVMHRSNLSRAEIEKIIEAQATREERLEHADAVIQNQGNLSELEAEVHQLHQKILQIKKDQASSS